MDYQAYQPSDELSVWVKCYWTLEADDSHAGVLQKILPDACMEMIFHLGDPYQQLIHQEAASHFKMQPLAFVFGQISKALEIRPTGLTKIFAIRFHPGCFSQFSDYPQKDMKDQAVPLVNIFGNKADTIFNQIKEAADTDERIKSIENILIDNFRHIDNHQKIISDCIDLIEELGSGVKVDTLAKELKQNRRKLEREFEEKVGLSPKHYLRIVRLQNGLRALAKGKNSKLGHIAVDNQYFDQAHFIKDFKEFTGKSPGKYVLDEFKMNSFFVDDKDENEK